MLKDYLIHTLSEIEQVTGYDAYGNPTYSSLATNVSARVEEGVFRDVTTAARTVTITAEIYMDATPVVQPEYKITWGSKILEVVTVSPYAMFGDNEYQKLSCTEVNV